MTFDPEIMKRLPAELLAEISENVFRKDLTPSELDAARRLVEPYIAEVAKERQREGGRRKAGGKLPAAKKYKTGDVVAGLLGTSRRQLEKIAEVVDAAKADPQRFGKLLQMMDRQGKVYDAHRHLQVIRDRERVEKLKPIAGRFRTLIIDPPWEYDDNVAGQTQPNYTTIDFQGLLRLPVPEWAEDNCHCYLWTTNAMLSSALALLASWGFKYKTMLTWHKPHAGLGVYFRNQTEHILFGVKGRLGTRDNLANVFDGAVGRTHSEKPDKFYEIVQAASYPPYGEAFLRKPRDGFTNLYQEAAQDNERCRLTV
jgi:N6-adenosine-specific RNA methylase IME4